MRPRSRIRRLAKWTTLAASILLLTACVFTAGYRAAWVRDDLKMAITLEDGSLLVARLGSNAHYPTSFHFNGPPGWELMPCDEEENWRRLQSVAIPEFQILPTYSYIRVPLWMPCILILGALLRLWQVHHSFPPPACRRCGYDLRGNTSGVCPECGTRK
jgi:hypothetical protein